MFVGKSPTPLGLELRRMRELAGLDQQPLAELLGVGQSTLSRYELGSTRPSKDMVMAWLDHCRRTARTRLDDDSMTIRDHRKLTAAVEEMEDEAYRELLERLFDDAETEVISAYTIYRSGQPQRQQEVYAAFRSAQLVRAFDPMMLPGALQTADYARLVYNLDAEHAGASAEQVEAAISVRLDYGRQLCDSVETEFHALVHENALDVQWVGGMPSVRAGVLNHLVRMAAAPAITLRVILRQAHLPSMVLGGFTMLSGSEQQPSVIVETYSAQLNFTALRDLEEYEHRWALFSSAAMEPEESRAWLAKQARQSR
jgi:transcriptional regulator with XRE-family HTH domain